MLLLRNPTLLSYHQNLALSRDFDKNIQNLLFAGND